MLAIIGLCVVLCVVVVIGKVLDFFWPSVVVACVLFVVALASFVIDGGDQTCRSGEQMGTDLVLSETSDQFILDEPAIKALPSTTLVNCTWDGTSGGSYAQLIQRFNGPKAWELAKAALQSSSPEGMFRFNNDAMYGQTGTTMPTHIMIVRIGGLLCEVRLTTGVVFNLQNLELNAREVCEEVASS